VSGGGSFAARLLKDAGADYPWADDTSTGSLMMSVEAVYEQAHDADFWLNVGYWGSRNAASEADERFEQFAAWKESRMYNNDARMGPGGGNDYYESSAANPHRVLADLIGILHPPLLPNHRLYYYRKLD
jgi:iron complex transport system substrate-binding protein